MVVHSQGFARPELEPGRAGLRPLVLRSGPRRRVGPVPFYRGGLTGDLVADGDLVASGVPSSGAGPMQPLRAAVSGTASRTRTLLLMPAGSAGL